MKAEEADADKQQEVLSALKGAVKALVVASAGRGGAGFSEADASLTTAAVTALRRVTTVGLRDKDEENSVFDAIRAAVADRRDEREMVAMVAEEMAVCTES